MAIIHDPPFAWDKARGPSCHLISTLPGEDGTAELLAFGQSIGIPDIAIQYEGTHREHFDLFGHRITDAGAAGAGKVSYGDLARAIRAKREAVEAGE